MRDLCPCRHCRHGGCQRRVRCGPVRWLRCRARRVPTGFPNCNQYVHCRKSVAEKYGRPFDGGCAVHDAGATNEPRRDGARGR